MSNTIFQRFSALQPPPVGLLFFKECVMIWTSLVFRIPALFVPREDRDVKDYVTRHLLKSLSEEKPMIHVTDEARDHILKRREHLPPGHEARGPLLRAGGLRATTDNRGAGKAGRVCPGYHQRYPGIHPQTFLGPLSPDHRREKAFRAKDAPPERLAAHLTARISRKGSRLLFLIVSFSTNAAGSAQGPFFHPISMHH